MESLKMSKIKNGWTVDSTKTQDTDLRIIQGHYPYAVKTELGEHIALVKSQKKANTGFAKAGTLNDRDEGFAIAELISAAPEMYAALEYVIGDHSVDINAFIEMDRGDWETFFELARKAMRKANPNYI